MAFTAEEKVRIRHHLGFLNVTNAATFVLGVPQAVETQFIIERAMNLVLPEAEPLARKILCTLDNIECQMVGDNELLAVEQLGDIRTREDEHKKLDVQYHRWRMALANILGMYPNPFDKRFSGGGGVNVPVVH